LIKDGDRRICEVAKPTQKTRCFRLDITTFMIAVFCLVEAHLGGRRLQNQSPQPLLRDSDVLTIEMVGEFLGIDPESLG
jgi:hypothetical protein